MKNYRIIATDRIIPHNEMRAEFPNVSFADAIDSDILEALGLEAAADTEPPAPTADQVQAAIVQAVQQRLDAFAQTRNYDGILSACTYANSSLPKFAAEGQAAVDLRDATWATLYTLLAEVLAETRPMLTGFADVEPLLPTLVWPA